MNKPIIRAIKDIDRDWVVRFSAEHWGSDQMMKLSWK